MSKPTPERDLHRLLRRLGGRGARLVPEGSGFRALGGEPSGAAKRSFPVEREIVETALSRGLMTECAEGAYRLSETGQALLRRVLAGGDGFSAQHQTRIVAAVEEEGGGYGNVVLNLDESPLAALRHRKGRDGRPLIDGAEFAAGERFRADYSRAQLMPRVTANWTASVAHGRRDGAGGMAELTGAAIDARRRVERAIAAVGPELAGVLIDFCCFLKGIEEIERARQWPTRSAKLVLRLALASLARHYGLASSAHGAASGGKIRHWGSKDYRPTVD